MADNESVSLKIDDALKMDGSDESFELSCSPCVRKNRNREATKYCMDCQDYYCSTCVEFHIDIPALTDHTILGRAEFPTNESDGLMTVPTDRCSIHGTKLTDMYCQKDDRIGCSICMAVEHRSCIDVVYIPKEIDNILKEEDIQKAKEDMKKANDRIREMTEKRQGDLAEIEKDMIVALCKIKDFREQINRTLDLLEKTTKMEFDALYEEIFAAVKADLEAMHDAVKDMEACQQNLQSAEGNRSQQFVCIKKGQQIMSEPYKISKDLAKYAGTIGVKFVVDKSIERFLNGLKSLGKNVEKSSSKHIDVKQHESLYEVTGRQKHEINVSACSLNGSCILTNGEILLTCHQNPNLLRLDSSTFKAIDQCDLPAIPYAVCEIRPHEAAVSLSNNSIQIVTLENKMAPTLSINLDHFCYGLAFSEGEMFVSDSGNKLYVHNTSGTLLRTIHQDDSGEDIFSQTRHVAVSDDGNTIYVAGEKKGVFVLDRKGTVLSRFSDPELSGAWGLCTDGCGNVFVSGYTSSNVIQIGYRGDKLGVIGNQSDNIDQPSSVCFDRSNSRMIVTSDNSKDITVLELV